MIELFATWRSRVARPEVMLDDLEAMYEQSLSK